MDLQSRLLMAATRKYFGLSMKLSQGAFNYPQVIPSHPITLYIHIPFCESLCPFCSFHRTKINRPLASDYFHALCVEVDRLQALGFMFNEVYVGGGTPTCMPDELVSLIGKILKLWSLTDVTVETNPNHLSAGVLTPLKQVGVTRLSVGVQSLQNEMLKRIGRYYPYGSRDKIIERLANTQEQFDTFNVDMIFNLPAQTLSEIENDITLLKSLAIDQISYYPLMPALNSKHKLQADFSEVSFEHEKTLYQQIKQQLTPDYHMASVWCFNRKNQLGDEYLVSSDQYLGIGSGAFSLLGNQFFATTFDIPGYISQTKRGDAPWQARQKLSNWQLRQYALLTRLFGLALPTNTPQLPAFSLRAMTLLGAIKKSGTNYHLTSKGQYWWLIMMREFFMGVNGYRRQLRDLNN